VENVGREGITRGVHQVGDVMYDSVLFHTRQAEQTSDVLARLGLESKQYYLATLHRAENTDDSRRLAGIVAALQQCEHKVVLPLHLRTRRALGGWRSQLNGRLLLSDPVSYLDMLMLEKHARITLTDSGGVQKEAYWMGVATSDLRPLLRTPSQINPNYRSKTVASRRFRITIKDSAQVGHRPLQFNEPPGPQRHREERSARRRPHTPFRLFDFVTLQLFDPSVP
jgi:UDP-N-acetylglucosamine 2-epimerase